MAELFMDLSPVRLPTDLQAGDIPRYFRRLFEIAPYEMWEQRYHHLQAVMNRHVASHALLRATYPIELSIGEVHSYKRHSGRLPKISPENFSLYSFVGGAACLHSRISDAAKSRLAGMIRHGLQHDAGLAPFAFELTIAAHFCGQGHDVYFADLEGQEQFDYLVRVGGIEIEVECKHVSGDIGRSIPRRRLYEVGTALQPVLEKNLAALKGGHLVRVHLEGRLSADNAAQHIISSQVGEMLSTGRCANPNVSSSTHTLNGSPFMSSHVSSDDLMAYFANTHGFTEPYAVYNWRPGVSAITVIFTSDRRDKQLDYLLKRWKEDAKHQFSRERPAFLCLHLSEFNRSQLQELSSNQNQRNPTPIQAAMGHLLTRRPWIHTAALFADGEVEAGRTANPQWKFLKRSGGCLTFSNPAHPEADGRSLAQIF